MTPGILPDISSAVVQLVVKEVERYAPFGYVPVTGVLWSSEGHVVTEAKFGELENVVGILADGRRDCGTGVASDGFTNLGLIKMSGAGYEPPAHTPSDDVRDGDVVYALSVDHRGIRRTVIARVITARRVIDQPRFSSGPYIEIDDEEKMVRGPIFNERGNLVGYVTLEGASDAKKPLVLATPISDVIRVIRELQTWGRVRR
jgi:S1-C subfamily serine protease